MESKQVLGVGPLANVSFNTEPVTDYRSSLTADARVIQQLGRGLLERGVLTNFAAKLYLSLAHTDADIDSTLETVEDTPRGIRGRR